MSATLADAFIAADSNPGHIEVGYGGVARNIAHNLVLLGAKTQLLTIFGDDLFGGLLHDYCKQQGIDVHLSERVSGVRSGIYLCMNNSGGEMIAAVADTEAIKAITPEWLAGALSALTPFPEDLWLKAMAETFTGPKAKLLEVNEKAFALGRAAAAK